MNLSVIIPVLNERAALPETVARAVACFPLAEIIVADGGSVDGTLDWVRSQPAVSLVEAERGRGPQMNAGAGAAGGDVLLFLHADCLLPQDAEAAILAALSDETVVGGAFRVRFPDGCPGAFRRLADLISLRSRLVSEASGDQAIFVRRSAFAASQGFPAWPLFEDFALVSRLKRLGRFRIVTPAVTLSPRRWEAHGIWRTSLLMCLLYMGYRLGIAPATLKHWFVDVRPSAPPG